MAGSEARELRRLLQQVFRRFGVFASDATPCGKPLSPAHAHALMVLLSGGEMTHQELGAELGIDKSNVARLCARMVEAGQATQVQSDTDGRSRRVVLTVAGQKLAREVDGASTARFGAVLRGVPTERRRHVLDALEQLSAAIGALSDEPKTSGDSARKGQK